MIADHVQKFCSKSCLNVYETANVLKCQLKAGHKCNTRFVKANAPCFFMGKWFCSEQCVEQDEDIKAMQKLQEQEDELSEEVEVDL